MIDELAKRLRDAHERSQQRVLGSDIFGEAAARIEALEEALRRAKDKLECYRKNHSGKYVGGMEYSALMQAIRAALGDTK